MKTILHICDWYRAIGGAEKLLFDTLEGLERQGYENVVVYNDHPDQKKLTMERPAYPCVGLEFFVYYQVIHQKLARDSFRRVADVIRKHSPDVCHIHNLQNPYLTEFLIKSLPCVRSVHDPRLYCFTQWKLLPDQSICRYPLGSACIKNGCLTKGIFPKTAFDFNAAHVLHLYEIHKRMPVIIAESRAQIEVLVASGFHQDQIAWLPNFTPLWSQEDTEAFIDKHYDTQKLPVILFVGRASYEKGAQVLIEACRYIKSSCQIVLITAGPMLEQLKSQADEFDEKVKIIMGLPYDATREWYAKAEVIVVPSVWLENFCLVGLEAYANMKPVIGSQIGGIKDWLKDGETGWFFPHGDAKALALKIDDALSDPQRLRKMGLAAYERARSYYNFELYLSRLKDIYRKSILRFGAMN